MDNETLIKLVEDILHQLREWDSDLSNQGDPFWICSDFNPFLGDWDDDEVDYAVDCLAEFGREHIEGFEYKGPGWSFTYDGSNGLPLYGNDPAPYNQHKKLHIKAFIKHLKSNQS